MRQDNSQGFYETSKEHYKRLLLQTILEKGPINRRQLSQLLNLRPATQKRFLSELLEAGLIQEEGNVIVRRGRGAIRLTVNPEGGRFIGVELDAHKVVGALCSFDLQVLRMAEEPIKASASVEKILEAMFAVIESLSGAPESGDKKLWGIGYGEYGLTNMAQGRHPAQHGAPQLAERSGAPDYGETLQRSRQL